jgi:cyclic pyranopterin phosphate synthase
MKLEDQYGRKIIKLRISLTDQCNLRCSYCMPIDQNFMKEDLFLSLDEYEDILTELKELGVEEIRLTGGEPLLSSKFKEMCSLVHRLNFKKIGITYLIDILSI